MGIQAVAFGAGDEAVEGGGTLGGFIVVSEEPAFAADPHPPQVALGGVVIDVEGAMRGLDLRGVL